MEPVTKRSGKGSSNTTTTFTSFIVELNLMDHMEFMHVDTYINNTTQSSILGILQT